MATPSFITTSPAPASAQQPQPQPIKTRNILPLPRRPLRDRLPPEVAATIQYPPSNPSRVWPYLPDTPPKDEPLNLQGYYGEGNGLHNGVNIQGHGDVRNTSVPRSPPEILSRNRLTVRPDNIKPVTPQPILSATTSTEGIDTFESNNKKKRKVPTNGDPILHGNIGECSPPFSASTVSPTTPIHHGTTSVPCSSPMSYSSPSPYSSMGISGSGRGTLAARSRNVRSPLRDIAGGNANWARSPKSRSGNFAVQTGDKKPAGIISNAIADAEKTQGAQGQNGANPRLSSDFSFRCQSQVPGSGLLDQLDAPQQASVTEPPSPNPTTAAQHGSPKPAPDPAEVERKNRRKLAREYADAARDRKYKTQLNNYHNPPKPEDMWICEFCEYERIFGEPPRALIRQYEIKDRQLRLQEAERRRLLEKAKAKSRKAKKAVNGNSKQTARSAHHQHGQPMDHQHPLSGDGHPLEEGDGGWAPDLDRGNSTQSADHDSDDVEVDSDEGPPDLVPEYPNIVERPPNTMIRQAAG